MVLVAVVYIIDRYYRTLLQTALLRSQSIESEDTPLRRGLGHYLATTYDKKIMSYLMFSVYLGFVVALVVLGYYVMTAEASSMGSQNTPRLWPVQATDVQVDDDLASRLWDTAYLWIPLAVTAIITVILLVTIFLNELAQTRRIDRAKGLIKNFEKNREIQTLNEADRRDIDLFDALRYKPQEPKDRKKIDRERERIKRKINKIKRDRNILDHLEGDE